VLQIRVGRRRTSRNRDQQDYGGGSGYDWTDPGQTPPLWPGATQDRIDISKLTPALVTPGKMIFNGSTVLRRQRPVEVRREVSWAEV